MPATYMFTPEQFGQYRLVVHLGRGGMADVYKAHLVGAAGFARYVVVKRILKERMNEPHFVEMFTNEAKIAVRLSHPNIVQVYELGEVNGELFIAMEYVRGVDCLQLLHAATEAGECLSPLIAAHIIRSVACALSHAHSYVDENEMARPIIHRDVSPQNIMIGYDGQIKLVDFGIAKAMAANHDVTHTTSFKGKVGYMAPEQIAGICTPRTDIFSTGALFHELLTSKRLFGGQNVYEVIHNVRTAPIPLPSSIRQELPPELDAIVMKTLARDPDERYESAEALIQDLDQFLHRAGFAGSSLVTLVRRLVPYKSEPNPAGIGPLPSNPTPHTPGGRSDPVTPLSGNTSPSSDRRLLVLGLGAAGLLLSVGGVAWLSQNRTVAKQDPPSLPPPATSPALPSASRPMASRLHAVRLESEPPGATVYSGPRRLGRTPVELEVRGEAVDVSLALQGYKELHYTVRPGDAPSLSLRLHALDDSRPRSEAHARSGVHGVSRSLEQRSPPLKPVLEPTSPSSPPSDPSPVTGEERATGRVEHASPPGPRFRSVDERIATPRGKIRAVPD